MRPTHLPARRTEGPVLPHRHARLAFTAQLPISDEIISSATPTDPLGPQQKRRKLSASPGNETSGSDPAPGNVTHLSDDFFSWREKNTTLLRSKRSGAYKWQASRAPGDPLTLRLPPRTVSSISANFHSLARGPRGRVLLHGQSAGHRVGSRDGKLTIRDGHRIGMFFTKDRT
ncbi:hypothetical protein Bbelb_323960 [Branchiostoma belcheri]|nr:hypothetical protein Bbelb_323960 [Branchiostoma belcheri]